MSVFMLEDDFRAIGISKGVREVALGDAWLQFATYDGTARDFFEERKDDKPHWFVAPKAESAEHAAFYSLTAQSAYHKEHGDAATRELLATEGLKLGQIKAPAKVDGAAGETNPYSDAFKGTPAEKEARIQSLIRSSAMLATQLARAAGKTITGQPLRVVGQR